MVEYTRLACFAERKGEVTLNRKYMKLTIAMVMVYGVLFIVFPEDVSFITSDKYAELMDHYIEIYLQYLRIVRRKGRRRWTSRKEKRRAVARIRMRRSTKRQKKICRMRKMRKLQKIERRFAKNCAKLNSSIQEMNDAGSSEDTLRNLASENAKRTFSKSCKNLVYSLRELLGIASECGIPESFSQLPDERKHPSYQIGVIFGAVLIMFLCQFESMDSFFKDCSTETCLKNIFGKKGPKTDAVRRVLIKTKPEDMNPIMWRIVKYFFENSDMVDAARIGGYLVAAFDGHEYGKTKKKKPDKYSLSRKLKSGATETFRRAVVCATVGGDLNTILGMTFLERAKDSAKKDEGELTGGKRLILELIEKLGPGFIDILVADALYLNAPFFNTVKGFVDAEGKPIPVELRKDNGIELVVRLKDKRRKIYKNAKNYFMSGNGFVDKYTVDGKIEVEVYEMVGKLLNGFDGEVRVLMFREKKILSKEEINEMGNINGTSVVTDDVNHRFNKYKKNCNSFSGCNTIDGDILNKYKANNNFYTNCSPPAEETVPNFISNEKQEQKAVKNKKWMTERKTERKTEKKTRKKARKKAGKKATKKKRRSKKRSDIYNKKYKHDFYKEIWLVTTDMNADRDILRQIMHERWDIENNVFHQLNTYYHAKHCYIHEASQVILQLIVMACNLHEFYLYKCGFYNLNPRKRKKKSVIKMFYNDLLTQDFSDIWVVETDGCNAVSA